MASQRLMAVNLTAVPIIRMVHSPNDKGQEREWESQVESRSNGKSTCECQNHMAKYNNFLTFFSFYLVGNNLGKS